MRERIALGVVTALVLVELPQPAAAEDREQFAVVIGNNAAKDTQLTPLHYADDDAVRFAELFRASGIQTELLVVADADTQALYADALVGSRAPTWANLNRATGKLFQAMRAAEQRGAETVFYFVYSGHGDVGRANTGRIFMHDRDLDRGTLLREVVGRSPATFNHLIIDACHSYFMVEPRGDSDEAQRSFEQILQSYLDNEGLNAHPNTGVLVSTSSRAEVRESPLFGGGIFSHQVRSALAGAADADNDGQVSYEEVAAFLAAANQDVRDVGTKLRVYSRPPALSNGVPVFRSAGVDARSYLRLGPTVEGHTTLVDDRGVRYLDVNKAAGVELLIGLVLRPRYSIRTPDKSGWIEPRAGSEVAVTWGGVELASFNRGDPAEMQGLYSTAFGPTFVRGYAAGAAQGDNRREPATQQAEQQERAKPRIAVSFTAISNAEISAFTSNAVVEQLVAAGYPVVDLAQLSAVRATWSLADIDAGKLASELSALDADLLLTGSIEIQPQGKVATSGWNSANVQLSARLVQVETAQATLAMQGEGTGLALGEVKAARRAASKAVEQLVAKLIEELPRLSTHTHRIDLVAHGIASPDVGQRLASALQGLSSVRSAQVRLFSPKVTRLELRCDDIDAFALAAEIADDVRVPLEVLQMSRSSLVARFAPLRERRLGVEVRPTSGQVGGKLAWAPAAVPALLATELGNRYYLEAVVSGQRSFASSQSKGAAKKITLVVESNVHRLAGDKLAINVEVKERDRGRRLAQVNGLASSDDLVERTQALGRTLADQLERVLARRQDLLGDAQPLLAPASSDSATPAQPLRIESVDLPAILPARVAHYARFSLAQVQVVNHGTQTIDELIVSLMVPRAMALPSEFAVGQLAAGRTATVAVPAILDAAQVLEVTEATPLQARISARYRIGEAWYLAERHQATVLLDRNTVDWSETASVAAFVTPQDEAVASYSRALLEVSAAGILPALAPAVRVVEALAANGVHYVADAALPYRSQLIDNVQFPAETMNRRSGDCDDLSVLTAALIEALGTRTALVATPGHLFILADTGLPAHLSGRSLYQGPRWVPRRGTLWIPLDVAAVDRGFLEVWERGGKEYERFAQQREVVDVADAWAQYPPVPSWQRRGQPTSGAAVVDAWYKDRLAAVGQALSSEVEKKLADDLAQARAKVARRPKDPEALCSLASLLASAGALDEGRQLLEQAEQLVQMSGKRRSQAAVLGARANVHLMSGEVKQAIEAYQHALDAGGGTPELYANIGLAQLAAGDQEAAIAAFRESARRGGREVLARMASAKLDPALKRDGRQGARATAPAVMQRDLQRLVGSVMAPQPEADMAAPSIRGEKPQTKGLLPGAQAPDYQVTPVGGRGAGSDEVPLATLLEWEATRLFSVTE